jgi:superfamily I DNA/RNA helicase
MQLVSKARLSGLVPIGSRGRGILEDTYENWEVLCDQLYSEFSEDIHYLARKSLQESIRQSYGGLIDFDDQIYMSALFGGVFQRYECVMVDEAQDLSALNHQQIKYTAAGRLICVGDPRQAVYAFRGADSSSMDNLRSLRSNWIDLPLSTTFRCPKAIVKRQQIHAPGFKAHETNTEGEFIDSTNKPWKIPAGKVAILCRNNAPLMACALRIIRSGLGCTVLGSELGKGLVNLSKKIVESDSTPSPSAMEKINNWASNEVAKALANGKESHADLITDKSECLRAVITECKTIGEARSILETMFSKDNLRITLSTGHKAKGLEWPTVIHLDPWRIPSKFAKKPGNSIALEQDLNLRYVIETRAQEKLILANLEDFNAK